MPRIEMTTPTVPAFAKFAQRISVPFSPVVRAGDWVYVSGLAPVNPETGGYDILTIEQQARRVMEHLKSCLEAAGSALDRVVKCNVYCSNGSLLRRDQQGLRRIFHHAQAARIFLCTAGWFGPFDMEIDCVALVK
jgi:2-iminobutanoate/2-iminopropanoate deaminase